MENVQTISMEPPIPFPEVAPRINIGLTIRDLRLERNMSQGDIEKRTGLLRCYLSRFRWASSFRKSPSRKPTASLSRRMRFGS